MTRWELFCRGVLYVSIQAGVVAAIAAYNLPLAFVTCAALSYLWTGNVQAQIAASRIDRLVYALGAGSGGVIGMVVGSWLAWSWRSASRSPCRPASHRFRRRVRRMP